MISIFQSFFFEPERIYRTSIKAPCIVVNPSLGVIQHLAIITIHKICVSNKPLPYNSFELV